MNLNTIIAVLELKGIISRAEGEKLVEYLANRPQSTVLSDAHQQVIELLGEVEVATKTIAEQAKVEAEKVVSEVKADVEQLAKETEAAVKKSVDKKKA